MTPVETLLAVRAAGGRLSVNYANSKLVIEWDTPLSDELWAAMAANRDRLVELLAIDPAVMRAAPACRQCGRQQHVPDYVCPNPTEPDTNYPIAAGWGKPGEPPIIPAPEHDHRGFIKGWASPITVGRPAPEEGLKP